MVRKAMFYLCGVAAGLSLVGITGGGILTMSPPLIDIGTAETLRSSAIIVLAISVIVGSSVFDRQWLN